MSDTTEACTKLDNLKPVFFYRPQQAVLTNSVLEFIRRYSGKYYPGMARDVFSGFRQLMQRVSSTPACQAGTVDSYEFAHVVDMSTKRFTINETFIYDGLELSVVAPRGNERTSIAERQATPEAREELMSPKQLVTYLVDELRTDPELWTHTKACTGVPAVEFFEHLKEFLTTSGKKLKVIDFNLSKDPHTGVQMNAVFLIPRVSAYYLRVKCKFK